MAIVLITRVAILGVIFLGVLVSITAIAGKEWRKIELSQGSIKITLSLWKYCQEIKGLVNACRTFKVSELADAKLKGEFQATRAFMIIGLIMHVLAFALLSMAQFLKKNIFQKLILPVFFSITVSGIIAMGCFTSYSKDSQDKSGCLPEINCPTFGWTYGIGWVTVVLALIGTVISTVGFFIQSERIGKQ